VPGLFQLLGGYLHRDWNLHYASWEDAVSAFSVESPPRTTERAVGDIDRLLAGSATDVQLRRVLEEIGCNVSLQDQGVTAREWLAQLRDRLAEMP